MKIKGIRSFSHKTFQVYHVYWNFIQGYMFRITLTFGTLKDGSLMINIFASSYCFSPRNIFQNGVHAMPFRHTHTQKKVETLSCLDYPIMIKFCYLVA